MGDQFTARARPAEGRRRRPLTHARSQRAEDCIRATAVDSLSHGYRTIVPIECVADKHESYHFANLTDLLIKYADVVDVKEVQDWLEAFES